MVAVAETAKNLRTRLIGLEEYLKGLQVAIDGLTPPRSAGSPRCTLIILLGSSLRRVNTVFKDGQQGVKQGKVII